MAQSPQARPAAPNDPWAALVDRDALRLVSGVSFVVLLSALGRLVSSDGAANVLLRVTPCSMAVEVEGTLRCDDDVLPLSAPVAIGRRVDGQGGVVPGDGWLPGRAFEVLALPVDLNSADLERLASLPGIGASRAVDIVAGRPIRSVEALDAIPGIGPATLERLRQRAWTRPALREPASSTDVTSRRTR